MRGKGEVGILTFAAKQESKSLFMSDTAILSWGLLGPLQQGTTALRSISTTWGGERYRSTLQKAPCVYHGLHSYFCIETTMGFGMGVLGRTFDSLPLETHQR
jgi:hypothetical protein